MAAVLLACQMLEDEIQRAVQRTGAQMPIVWVDAGLHEYPDRLREELYTIVDLGGAAIDVTVEHSIYGQITAPLHIFSRYDADAFCNKLEHSKARPLCDLTGGIHLHTVRAPDERTLDRVIAGLKEKGFLLEEEN